MKINWKVLVAFALLLTVIVWAVTSLRSRSYSGSNLNAAIGGGPITVINPSDQPAAVQLIGSGSRVFAVSSTTEGLLTGSSTRVGAGSTAAQVFDLTVPPGTSTFNVERGNNVSLVTGADTLLEVTVQPLNADNARTTLIIAGSVALLLLFYIANATRQQWMPRLQPQKATPVAPVAAPSIFNMPTPVKAGAANQSSLSFKEWLVGQSGRQDSVGELARTAASDPSFPNQAIDARQQLRRYNASDAILEACAQAIREYNLTA